MNMVVIFVWIKQDKEGKTSSLYERKKHRYAGIQGLKFNNYSLPLQQSLARYLIRLL